jgi:hypothetical protein
MSKRNLTPNQLLKLNHLNNYLIQKQNEIIVRHDFYNHLINDYKAKNQFTSDFQIKAEISYHVDESLVPDVFAHGLVWKDSIYNLTFEKEKWLNENEEENNLVELEKPCCYLLHTLLYESFLPLEWVFKIKSVWININLKDLSIADINLNTGEAKPKEKPTIKIEGRHVESN